MERQQLKLVKQLQDVLLTQVLRMHIGLSDEYVRRLHYRTSAVSNDNMKFIRWLDEG